MKTTLTTDWSSVVNVVFSSYLQIEHRKVYTLAAFCYLPLCICHC